MWTKLLSKGYQVINFADIGGVGDNTTDNSTNGALALAALLLAGGGILFFPPGTYLFSQTWVLDTLAFIRLIGAGVNQPGASCLTQLVYTGAGSAAISCRSSRGIGIEHLGVRCNNAGFTGYLLDFGQDTSTNTAGCYLLDCNVWNQAFPLSVPTALLHVGFTYDFTAEKCQFYGGQYNVVGIAAGGEFNNSVAFRNCYFQGSVNAAVKGIGNSWKFDTCIFEPISSGAAGALTYDPGIGAAGSVTFDNCVFVDDSSLVAGSWLTVGATKSLRITGGFMSLASQTTGINVATNGSQGIMVQGVEIQTPNVFAAVVNYGSTSGHSGLYYFGNSYNNVTPASPVQGTNVPTGLIDNGAGPVVRAHEIQVLGPPVFPNKLSAASADFEAGNPGNWAGNNNVTTPLTTTAADALHGSHCLQVVFAQTTLPYNTMSINSLGNAFAGLVAAAPGQTWLGTISFKPAPGSAPRLMEIDIYGASSATGANFQFLATSSGPAVRETAGQWIRRAVSLTLPATMPGGGVPNFLSLKVGWNDSAGNNFTVGEVHFVDCAMLRQIGQATPSAVDLLWLDVNQTNSNIILSGMTLAQGGSGATDLMIQAQGAGALYDGVGAGAGSGGLYGARPTYRDGGPTIAAGAGAGAAPTISVSGSDSGHVVNLTTDGSPSASATVFTVTFSNPFPIVPRSVAWSPANGNAAALAGTSSVWEDQASRTASIYVFKVGSGGLAPTTQYLWNVDVKG